MMEIDKYLIMPTKYVQLLNREQLNNLNEIVETVTKLREALGKDLDPRYYVCKQNEPYAQSVHDMIIEGERSKELLYDTEDAVLDDFFGKFSRENDDRM